MPFPRPLLLAILIALLAATLLAVSGGARAETYLLVAPGPGPQHGPHPGPPHRRPPPLPPAPAVVVVEPAPAVVATPAAAPAAAPEPAPYCREFQSVVLVDGRPQQSYGTACRQADGAWKIVSQTP